MQVGAGRGATRDGRGQGHGPSPGMGLTLTPCCSVLAIRDFPDHATFREKGAKLACADKLGVFLSLTQYNKDNFDPTMSQI